MHGRRVSKPSMEFRRRRSRSGSSQDADDFDLLIEESRVRVLEPENGPGPYVELSRPFPEDALAGTLNPGNPCRDVMSNPPVSQKELSEIGASLFKAVFAGEILAAWRSRLKEAAKEKRPLRLRLHLPLEGSSDPWAWPWELLHDQNFLALFPSTPVVRYVESEGFRQPLRVRPPIRVLVVTAHPKKLENLAIHEEMGELDRTLGSLEDSEWVEMEQLEGATRERLRRKLAEKTFHILHFIGHGAFDPEARGGALLLEGEGGEPDAMPAQELSVLLGAHPDLRLVVLNVCHGARGNAANPFSGLAQSLIVGGLPAVVAMQSSISDAAALCFSRTFYESMARREPLDRAVSLARNAMFMHGHTPDWAAPILATRSPNCRIFDLTWWEEAWEFMKRIVYACRYLIIPGVILIALALGIRFYGMRWFDLNWISKHQNPSDCPSPKNVSIAFVKVEPPGKAPFCMSRFEITQHQWKKIVGRPPTRRKGAGLPVVRISWNDTRRFLGRLNRLDQAGQYRLPTGEEWKYAARGGEDDPPPASSGTANCSNKEDPDGFEDTAPVGSYQPNLLGLYDMFGNASEWVSDSAISGKKIRRGGGFANALKNCSVKYESALAPDRQPNDAGFRIVREPLKP
jgi:hypothetical protein